jgi:hypothetical protein
VRINSDGSAEGFISSIMLNETGQTWFSTDANAFREFLMSHWLCPFKKLSRTAVWSCQQPSKWFGSRHLDITFRLQDNWCPKSQLSQTGIGWLELLHMRARLTRAVLNWRKRFSDHCSLFMLRRIGKESQQPRFDSQRLDAHIRNDDSNKGVISNNASKTLIYIIHCHLQSIMGLSTRLNAISPGGQP